MQQEQLRHQYLEAMGISSWLPRAQLPGAAPSAAWVKDFRYPAPDFSFTSEPESGESRPDMPRSAGSGQGARAALAALQQSEPSASPVQLVVETPAVVEAEPVGQAGSGAETETPSEVPQFKLAFFRVGDCLLVDSLPLQGDAFTAAYQKLAQAIVRAIGISGPVSEPFLLHWPMFASKTLDQSWTEAAKTVSHKLNRELQQPTRCVLFCGEAAAQMCLQRQESLDALQSILFTVGSGAKGLAGLSLSQLMHLPGAKKEFWLGLQPLLQFLQFDG